MIREKAKAKAKARRNPVPTSTSKNSSEQNSNSTDKKCFRCGGKWFKGHEKDCKAVKAKCHSCGTVGHFDKVCKKKNSSSKKQHVLEDNSANSAHEFYDENGQIVQQHMLTSRNHHQKELLIEFGAGLSLNSVDKKLLLKLDTGADVNSINKKTYEKLFSDAELMPSSAILENFDKTLVRPLGRIKCFLRWKKKFYRIDVEVMDQDDSPNVLCRETIFLMGILKPCFVLKKRNSTSSYSNAQETTELSSGVPESNSNPNTSVAKQFPPKTASPAGNSTTTRQNIDSNRKNSNSKDSIDPDSVEFIPLTEEKVKEVYKDVFEGLGTFPGEPYKLKLKPNAVPAKHRPRKVPVHLQEEFHSEVKKLVEMDVLEPVTEQTEWVNSYVIVEKKILVDSNSSHAPNHSIKKKLRLCLDPRDLNEALEREPYYCRSIDELIAKFSEAEFFSIVDMDKGYWQVLLDSSSRKYTCMALDIGRYQWKRLPMGTIVASDIFQKKLDSIYIGLPGVTGIADDMIVFGRSEAEHDRNFILFLETTRINGLRLNKEKLQFKREEVSFFGHTWNSTGISPDPKKINSILRMKFPEDKETMHSFLGLVNFLNRYSPDLTQFCTPLRKLILKDVPYRITEEHREAFSSIKKIFKKKIVLPYYSIHKNTILQVDASKKGFGACLIQDGNPVYYASRTLSSTEQNYQNLERECMAAVWGMEKFHYFLYGRHFILQTDQKPLVSIFKKHMVDVSPRIQRLAIRTWQYDFTPEWIPGKQNSISDALSRVSPLELQDSDKEGGILAVNILQNSNFENRELEELKHATSEDIELQALKNVISTGWPQKRSSLSSSLQNYWNYRDELTMENGILLKNYKILVPRSLQQKYLEKIHAGHQGINSCLQKAREFVFWHGYTKDITETVEKCILCQENNSNTSVKHHYLSDVPPHPWHTLGSDLFYFKKMDFLLLVDYFSKFPIVRRIPNSTTGAVKKELRDIFTEFGVPFILRSDNGPCYASEEFKFFLQEFRIDHLTSSPHYPQSNGLAESMVKIAKKHIEKAILEDRPWNEFLLQYRMTPLSAELPSPAEILFGRKFRSNLTVLPSQLMNSTIKKQRELIAKKENKFYPQNRNSTTEMPLEVGQKIWHQDPHTKKWIPGTIQEFCKEPNSYILKSENGATYRRNRNFIKPRQSSFEKNSNSTQQKPVPGITSTFPEVVNSNFKNYNSHTHSAPMQPVPNSITNTSEQSASKNSNSTVQNSITPAAVRVSPRINKGVAPERFGYGK